MTVWDGGIRKEKWECIAHVWERLFAERACLYSGNKHNHPLKMSIRWTAVAKEGNSHDIMWMSTYGIAYIRAEEKRTRRKQDDPYPTYGSCCTAERKNWTGTYQWHMTACYSSHNRRTIEVEYLSLAWLNQRFSFAFRHDLQQHDASSWWICSERPSCLWVWSATVNKEISLLRSTRRLFSCRSLPKCGWFSRWLVEE